MIKTICEYCGKECDFTTANYLASKHHYCSRECYYADKPNKVKSGPESIYYNRIKTTCTNCGKEIEVIPYSYNMKNSFGDNHNFCCKECYWEYRSKYYVGEKHADRREFTQEERDKMRIHCLNNIKNMTSKDTKIQIAVNEMLDFLKINYEREYTAKYYSIDNYLIDYDLMIEVMGDYWHANPIIYNETNKFIDQIQYKDIRRDKSKNSYLKGHRNIDILYLWERDIINNRELCISLIEEYVGNNGIIDDYNSFNWHLTPDRILKLNNNIIKPYFKVENDISKKLLKK